MAQFPNLEKLTYNEIPSLIKAGGHKWALHSGSACPKIWCQRTVEDFPTWMDDPKEKRMEKIKGGYVVYIHW